MPLQYPSGTLAEHRACRTSAVAFDVSHLGTVRVTGPDAFDRLQAALTNDLGKVGPGPGAVHPPARRGRRLGARRHHRVVGRRRALRRHAQRVEHRPGRGRARRGGGRRHRRAGHHRRAGPAGPGAARAGQPRGGGHRALPRRPVHLERHRVRGGRHRLHRRGRGRGGRPGRARRRRSGTPCSAAGVVPAGLGARDTLRLEAGLPLHGHELGAGHHPAAGRARLGGQLEQGRRSGAATPWPPRRSGAWPGCCAAS